MSTPPGKIGGRFPPLEKFGAQLEIGSNFIVAYISFDNWINKNILAAPLSA